MAGVANGRRWTSHLRLSPNGHRALHVAEMEPPHCCEPDGVLVWPSHGRNSGQFRRRPAPPRRCACLYCSRRQEAAS
uniref:Uncharacterized protein n=1 Tax=Arundo donax TaxID=35708 RepID=A0A0A9DVI0_ARUDO